MPIEIKEMHIKINVSEDNNAPRSSVDNAGDAMIQECMDQVAKMLNDKEER